MNPVQKSIIQNHKMLNAIRYQQGFDTTVEKLRDIVGISRATADRVLEKLSDTGDPLVKKQKQDRRFIITYDAALFLGISIGSSYIQVVLLGLDFKPIKRETIENVYGFSHIAIKEAEENSAGVSTDESYAFNTPTGDNEFSKIREIITAIIEPMLSRCCTSAEQVSDELKPFWLMGIGFGVTGPVEYRKKKWLSSPRIPEVRNATLEDLLGAKLYNDALNKGVFLSIDNNAKASIVAEYQGLMEQSIGNDEDPGNVAILYVGKGIGMATVLDRKLIRGNNNLSGEVGQLRSIETSDKDSAIHYKVIEKELERELKCESDKAYNKYLPIVLNSITCITGINRIILVGYSKKKVCDIIRNLKDQRIGFTITSTQNHWTLEEGIFIPCAAAIGAAIESYFTMCNFDIDSEYQKNRVNLAIEITW